MSKDVVVPMHTMPVPQMASEAAAVINMIERVARDPSVDIARLHELLTLRAQMEDRNAKREFASAMVAAQTEMRPVAADCANTQTKSKYASFHALNRALHPIYSRHGFTVSFDTGDADDQQVRVIAILEHANGHSRQYHIDMPADGKGAKGNDVMTKTHATGSAVTYGRRYLLTMIFNVAVGDDDDGNSAARSNGNHNSNSHYITDEQCEHIRKLITETNSNLDLFLKFVGAPSISDIAVVKYERAVAALEAKRAKQK